MRTPIDIKKIDQWREYLRRDYLRLQELRTPWAADKADTVAALSEFLRKVREEHQMTGLNGRPIDEPHAQARRPNET